MHIDKHQAINTTLTILKGKRKPYIIYQLYLNSPMRFTELQKAVSPISKKALTDHLRNLEKNGLVQRTVYPEIPPRVEYALTELGYSMQSIYDAIILWKDTYHPIKSDLIFEVISDKWTPLIMRTMNRSTKRFGEIKQELTPISQKVLTQRLRHLEMHGVINRTVYDEVPLRVEYAFTELGLSLQSIFMAMLAWGKHYLQSTDSIPF